MDVKQQALFEARARIMKAMAHSTRLFIIEQLSHREHCVCELRDMVGADVSTISRHLALLKNAGIVKDDKRGAQVFYRLRCPCVLNLFVCIEGVLKESAKSQMALVR